MIKFFLKDLIDIIITGIITVFKIISLPLYKKEKMEKEEKTITENSLIEAEQIDINNLFMDTLKTIYNEDNKQIANYSVLIPVEFNNKVYPCEVIIKRKMEN